MNTYIVLESQEETIQLSAVITDSGLYTSQSLCFIDEFGDTEEIWQGEHYLTTEVWKYLNGMKCDDFMDIHERLNEYRDEMLRMFKRAFDLGILKMLN